MKEEIHIEDSEENPVVSRVLKYIHKRHSIIAKSVYKYSLKFSFNVMEQHHENAKLLVESIYTLFSVNLFLENYQKQSNQNWTEVLYKEHSCPTNLGS